MIQLFGFWGHLSFLLSDWYPCSGLLVTSALGFKARVDPLACRLHHLYAIDSSDWPLVQHLLTWWLSSFSIHSLTHIKVLVGFESFLWPCGWEQDWYFVIREDSRVTFEYLVSQNRWTFIRPSGTAYDRSRWRNYSSLDRDVTNTLSALLRRFSVINLSILQVWFYTYAYRIVLLAECSSNVQVL